MFTDTLNKVTQGYIAHTPLRMIQVITNDVNHHSLIIEVAFKSFNFLFQSLTLKSKDSAGKFKERGEDFNHQKNLLLWMVRLIHADPMLMLNVTTLFFFSCQSSC